jgi:hypothetical protein
MSSTNTDERLRGHKKERPQQGGLGGWLFHRNAVGQLLYGLLVAGPSPWDISSKVRCSSHEISARADV